MSETEAAYTADQPMPTPGKVDVPPIVAAWFTRDLSARSQRGLETYGTTLQTHNGRDAGQDAWEELIDLAQYLTQLRLEHVDALAALDALRAASIAESGWTNADGSPESYWCRLCECRGTTPAEIGHDDDCPMRGHTIEAEQGPLTAEQILETVHAFVEHHDGGQAGQPGHPKTYGEEEVWQAEWDRRYEAIRQLSAVKEG